MPKYRDFGSPAASDEPVMFKLYGTKFKCVPALQGRQLMDLIANTNVEDVSGSARAMLGFFDQVLIPEDAERFREMTNSQTHIVPMETLSEIMSWLIEVYSGERPTEESVAS